MLSDEEKKAIKGLEWSQQQMRLGNLPDYNQGHYADIRIVLNLIEVLKEKIKKAIDFIDDKNNYFEDGENWQNILKIKEILEGKKNNVR